MKHIFKTVIIAAFLTLAPLLLFSQLPPHPGDGKPPTGDPVGEAGAPVGNGTFILFTFALAYAVRKIYVVRSTAETK
jgi:polyferredoxin